MIKKIAHVAIVVHNLDEAIRFYQDTLGITCTRVTNVATDGVKVAFLPLGDSEIELLEPVDPQGSVARFLAKHGEGLHHLCLETDDISQEVSALQRKETRMIDKAPRPGAEGLVAFVHPQAAHGVLIELSDQSAPAEERYDH